VYRVNTDKIVVFEMHCYRRLLNIKWTQKVTNTKIRRRLNIEKDLIQAGMGRKLGSFGHVCRMKNNRKIKVVMMGMMEGTGWRERPHREWMDDIRDWLQTDVHRLSFTGTRQRDMENDYKKCIGHLRALCPWITMM